MNRFYCEIEPWKYGPPPTARVLYSLERLAGGFPLSPAALGGVLAFHAVSALAMRSVPLLSAAHAAATLLAGIWFAISGRRMERVAYTAAYICGAEVLWRMTRAPIFWEFGKYAIILIFLIALIRSERWRLHDMSLIYLLLLLPSTSTTLVALPMSLARQEISFNLSGPFALVVSVIFFYNLRMTAAEMRGLFVAVLAPVFGIAVIALFSMATAETIEFTGESNPITSGGYGPNQVSGMMGLAAVAVFLCLMHGQMKPIMRIGLGALLTMLVGQCALTFSRSGLYAAGGAVLACCFCLAHDPRLRRRLSVVLVVVPVLAASVLIWENAFTGGALADRFADTSLTHRAELTQQDLAVWAAYPVFGAGPGMAKPAHSNRLAAHTEFSRLLAEHGIFGLAAMMFLGAMAIQQLRESPGWVARGMSLAFVVWSCMFMSASAMRIAAPSFVFGMAFVRLTPLKEGTYQFRNVVAVSRARR